jgi:mutator protein MutT
MIKVAVLWLVNEHNELLLARRADHKAQDPGVWGPTVTGKMEVGETFDQTLRREVEEEIALQPASYAPDPLLEVEYRHPDGEIRLFAIYYAKVRKDIDASIHIDTNEVAEIGWYSLNCVQELLDTKAKSLVPSAPKVWPQTFQALSKAVATNKG